MNNDDTEAVINIVHTLGSTVHLQQNVTTVVGIFRCSMWKNVLKECNNTVAHLLTNVSITFGQSQILVIDNSRHPPAQGQQNI